MSGWLDAGRYFPPALARARHGVALARDASFAVAHFRTAGQLARETGHAEIAVWCLETQAW